MTVSPVLAAGTRHVWSAQEKGVLASAARTALHCGVGSAWTLRMWEHDVELHERFHATSWHHEGAGRDRVIACGAALAGVVVAVRVLGWLPEIMMLGDAARPELVATVGARARHRPSARDVRWFKAGFGRRWHRGTLDPEELDPALVDELVCAGTGQGVSVVPVSAFAPGNRKQPLEPGLLIVTAADGRRDQVAAGVAMQHCALAASARGLTAEPRTGPFQFREFRRRVLRGRGLSGSPQLLLRLGERGPVEPGSRQG
ncbi:hypothetical protein BAY61_17485 [Prauserella marina]|uniref:hypothetical protein n=1 Tax=Prauserella marina TaxID=530584 RepID=UPI000B83015D|nr:hypothetical protein [Prauserella marina]ASR39385.1 hypothetical protein BAY61_17485 [Prauserella marina]